MTIRIFATLPFSEAITKRVGQHVAMGWKARQILEVKQDGKNSPYFRLDGVPEDHWLCQDFPGFISWQVLGDAKPQGQLSGRII